MSNIDTVKDDLINILKEQLVQYETLKDILIRENKRLNDEIKQQEETISKLTHIYYVLDNLLYYTLEELQNIPRVYRVGIFNRIQSWYKRFKELQQF